MADRDEVLAKLAHLRRRAYLPVTEPGDGVAVDSKIGGTPYLAASSEWPACERCGERLALVVQLNPAQLPEPLRKTYGADLVQLFACIGDSCGAPTTVRALAIDGDPAAPEARPPRELEPAVIRRWTATDDYPYLREHARLGVELADDELELAETLTVAGDKLSGWPMWVGDTDYPSCDMCGKTMRLVFQLEPSGKVGLAGGLGRGHLTQCHEHPWVLVFAWASS